MSDWLTDAEVKMFTDGCPVGPDCDECDLLLERIEQTLAARVQAAKAEALRDASKHWACAEVGDGPLHPDTHTCDCGDARWLRDRADEIEAERETLRAGLLALLDAEAGDGDA